MRKTTLCVFMPLCLALEGGSSFCVRPGFEVYVCSCLLHLRYNKAIVRLHSFLCLVIMVVER
jgi:hypothetical protein